MKRKAPKYSSIAIHQNTGQCGCFNNERRERDPRTDFIVKVTCLVIQFILFLAAIAALIIVATYDKDASPCNDGTDYTVDLQRFLQAGSGVQMIYFAFWSHKAPDFTGVYECVRVFILLFLCAWSIIGSVMYNDQMSKECQDESIAKMILWWSVIPFCIVLVGRGRCSLCV
eukprot:1015074_1